MIQLQCAGWVFVSVVVAAMPSGSPAAAHFSNQVSPKPVPCQDSSDLNVPSTPKYTVGVGGTQVILTWTDAPDTRTNFEIEQRNDDDTGKNFRMVLKMDASANTATISNLTPGGHYSFRVRAVGVGTSVYSQVISITASQG